jgi:uncharacterized protein YndB with AHSA1/START domain
MRNIYSIEIQAPPERVFHWLNDSKRAMRWLPNLVEGEDLVRTATGVGTTFRHVYEERGRRMPMQGKVTAYESNRRLRSELSGDLFDLTVDYRLESVGNCTRLTQESQTRFKSMPMRILGAVLMPLMKKASVRALDESLGKLKLLAEDANEPPSRA